eukprot:18939-Lingulodinium_polyedra.AAC.1
MNVRNWPHNAWCGRSITHCEACAYSGDDRDLTLKNSAENCAARGVIAGPDRLALENCRAHAHEHVRGCDGGC